MSFFWPRLCQPWAQRSRSSARRSSARSGQIDDAEDGTREESAITGRGGYVTVEGPIHRPRRGLMRLQLLEAHDADPANGPLLEMRDVRVAKARGINLRGC